MANRFKRTAVIALVLSSGIQSGQLPALRIPEPFGVNIHRLSDPEQDLDAIYNSGFRIVRSDLLWANIEKSRGIFNFTEYDSLIRSIVNHNLRPLLILDYSNALYEPVVNFPEGKGIGSATRAPQNPESRQAFLAFALASLHHFKYANPIWEIWNEPEGAQFWPPAANVADYIQLAKMTCRSMKQTAPEATIIGPGAAQAPTYLDPKPPFLKSVLQSDLATCLDAVSVHPYMHIENLDWAPAMWAAIRQLIPSTAPRLVPVDSESGLSSYRYSKNERFTDETQASYLVRMMLLNMAGSIPVSVWYDWKDDGTEEANPEHHFGITGLDGAPKAAGLAMRAMTQLLAGSQFACRIPGPQATQLIFSNRSERLNYLVVWANPGPVRWSAEQSVNLTFQTPLKLGRTTNMFGAETQVSQKNGTVTLVGYQPFYSTIQPKFLPAACLARLNN